MNPQKLVDTATALVAGDKGLPAQQQYEIGMVGLGVMGRNLMLNMADRGCAVADYDKDQ